MATCEPTHLLEPRDRHQGGERFALALDDDLVVAPIRRLTSIVDTLSAMQRCWLPHLPTVGLSIADAQLDA